MENRVGPAHLYLKPILFDAIHRFWRYIMLDAVTLDQVRTFIAVAEQAPERKTCEQEGCESVIQ